MKWWLYTEKSTTFSKWHCVLSRTTLCAGTSSDMTAATGLTKGCIYGNFENKDNVMIAVFKHNSGELAKNADVAISALTSACKGGSQEKNYKKLFD